MSEPCRFVNRGRRCGRPEEEHCPLRSDEFHEPGGPIHTQPSPIERDCLGIPDDVQIYTRGERCKKVHHTFHRASKVRVKQ